MGETPTFGLPVGLLDLAAELEAEWPRMHADLRASGVPLNDGEEPDGGVAVAEPAAAEPADVAPAEQEPVTEPAAPSFDPREIQAENEYLRQQFETQQQQLAQLASLYQGAQRQGQQPQPGFDPSSLTDEYGNLNPAALTGLFQTFGQQMLSAMDQRLQQIQAPLAARAEAETVAEGEARIGDMLADDIARNGEFAADEEADRQARQLVRSLAEQMFPDVQARYGATPRAAEIAIGRAAEQVRGLLKSVGAQAQTEQQNRLAALAGARGEPGSAGINGVQAPQVRVGERVTDRYAAAA